jgi:hypothetical protein
MDINTILLIVTIFLTGTGLFILLEIRKFLLKILSGVWGLPQI